MKLASWTGAAFSFTTGNPYPNAVVEVRRESDGGLAQIFSDVDGASPIAQPGFQADAQGMIHFYALGSVGGYQIKVTMGAEVRTLRHQAVGNIGQLDLPYAAGRFPDAKMLSNLAPVFSVGANALTITLKASGGVDLSEDAPGFISQRSATLASGGFNVRTIDANLSLVISAGSTLGHAANILQPVYIYVVDSAGAQKLAASGTFFGESGIITTVAEGGAGGADTLTTMYSDAVYAGVPFRLVAIAWFNQAVAGNWVNLPSEAKVPPFHLERVGVTEDYKGGTVPYGFMLEDGSNVSRSTFAKLFGKIGTTWGVGDGSTTFGLPDSRRRASVGSGGTGTGTLGNTVGNVGGAETHTLMTSELASHLHSQSYVNFTGPSGGGSGGANFASGTNTGLTGGGGAHNNMQPSMVVTKMIRWLGDI